MTSYTRAEQAQLQSIKDFEKHILQRREYEYESLKRQAALAKKIYEEAQADLRHMIFTDAEQLQLPGMEHDAMAREDAQPRRWQDIPIGVAVHDPLAAKALVANGIENVGQLAQYTSDGKSLAQLDGIGEMLEAKIIEQMQMFWDSNPGIDADSE